MRPLIHQKAPSFNIQFSEKVSATAHAGVCLIRESLHRLGLIDLMKSFGLKKTGFSDEVILEAFILLLAQGGESLSDWDYLKAEQAFSRMFATDCPSVDTLERYLKRLSLQIPSRTSDAGKVGWIAEFELLHERLILQAYSKAGNPKKLTLDLDAMLIPTDKRDALFCYDSYKAYHPLNAYCPELEMLLAHEFRDGNVSPMEGYKRIIERCRKILPEVRWIVRSDSAGYQNELLDFLDDQGIAYTITVRETEALQQNFDRAKDWKPLIVEGFNLGEEITEIFHTPAFSSKKELKKRVQKRRYLAVRKTKGQQNLFSYHQVIVTNDLHSSLEKVVQTHRKRCGSVEYFHAQTKSQGGAHVPSNDFKVNAAWYSLVCLTHNLLRFLQHFVLPETYKKIELKTLRFRLLNQAAVVIKKARQLTIRFCQNAKAFQDYSFAWQSLAHLNL